ncbi:hypothetical protein MPSEU_000597800 [Mayamaea pseudoterrestris]|nr:hypothetical protein MPSEU_000597800 [Mayamaea pseudoterrestris]
MSNSLLKRSAASENEEPGKAPRLVLRPPNPLTAMEAVAIAKRISEIPLDHWDPLPQMQDFEVIPLEEWLDGQERYLDENIASIHGRVDFIDLVVMALRPDSLQRWLEALLTRSTGIAPVKSLFFQAFDGNEERLENLPPREKIIKAAIEIGQVACCLPMLEEGIVQLYDSPSQNPAIAFAHILPYCLNLKKLAMDVTGIFHVVQWEDERIESLQIFANALKGNSTVEEVAFHSTEVIGPLVAALRPLLSLPRLRKLTVNALDVKKYFDDNVVNFLHDGSHVIVSTVEGAAVLGSGLMVKTLTSATMNQLAFMTEEATDIFCEGLRNSNVQRFQALALTIPESKGSSLAEAIVGSKILALDLECHAGLSSVEFFMGLNNGLRDSPSVVVEDLTVTFDACGNLPALQATNCILALLQDSSSWRLCKLTLALKAEHWNDNVELALAQMIAATTHLRNLKVTCAQGAAKEPRNALLEAISAGTGCIDEIDFSGILTSNGLAMIEKATLYNVNRLKRIHGPSFELARQETDADARRTKLAQALAPLDSVARFALLRGDCYGCRDMILETAGAAAAEERHL